MKKAQASLEHLIRVFTVPEQGDSKLALIEEQLSDNLSEFLRQHVVTQARSLEDLEKDFAEFKVPEQPEFVSTHAEHLLQKLVANSVNTYSPTFIGHMTSALPYFHLPLSKLLVGLNQNPVKIETSKAFTPLERQVIGMLHQLIYDYGDDFYSQHLHSANHALGTFCSGGTVANITALWVARNSLFPVADGFRGIAKEGLGAALAHYGYKKLGVICSRRGHYSLSKAVDLLGLGREQLLTIDCPSQTLSADAARAKARDFEAQGNKVLAIVGVAGTTETGHIDPLNDLADLAEELGCHFHVDAAWGGPTLFSRTHGPLLSGIERADSVTVDAHKQMYVPMGAGMVLFKDPKKSNAVRHHANYILRAGSKDLGAMTLEGSRNGMAMLVYSALHIFGRSGYELLIDQSIEKARLFARLIEADPHFELITEPTLCILTYRVCPQNVQKQLQRVPLAEQETLNKDLNELTVRVQKQQRESGKSFVSRTRLQIPRYQGQHITVFRVILANPLTTEQDLLDILQEQKDISQGTQVLQQMVDAA